MPCRNDTNDTRHGFGVLELEGHSRYEAQGCGPGVSSIKLLLEKLQLKAFCFAVVPEFCFCLSDVCAQGRKGEGRKSKRKHLN